MRDEFWGTLRENGAVQVITKTEYSYITLKLPTAPKTPVCVEGGKRREGEE